MDGEKEENDTTVLMRVLRGEARMHSVWESQNTMAHKLASLVNVRSNSEVRRKCSHGQLVPCIRARPLLRLVGIATVHPSHKSCALERHSTYLPQISDTSVGTAKRAWQGVPGVFQKRVGS